MKYNLLVREENEGIIESIIDSANGKLIIACDNSFVISSIVEELKEGAMNGGFELFNGNVKVNPDVKSNVKIVAINTSSMDVVEYRKVWYDFKMATFTRESKGSFVFDITLTTIEGSPEVEKSIHPSSTEINIKGDSISRILSSIRDHNVVFVQDLNDKVVKSIQSKRDDTSIFANISSFSNDYVITGDDGVMVAKFDAPENNTIEYRDCMSFVPNALKSGVTVVCNTTWVRFFLELTSVEYDVNLSSVVIYNNSDFGPMGNKELYKMDEK